MEAVQTRWAHKHTHISDFFCSFRQRYSGILNTFEDRGSRIVAYSSPTILNNHFPFSIWECPKTWTSTQFWSFWGLKPEGPQKYFKKCLGLLCFVLPRYAKEHSKLSVTYCLVVMDVFLCFFGCILSIFIFFMWCMLLWRRSQRKA